MRGRGGGRRGGGGRHHQDPDRGIPHGVAGQLEKYIRPLIFMQLQGCNPDEVFIARGLAKSRHILQRFCSDGDFRRFLVLQDKFGSIELTKDEKVPEGYNGTYVDVFKTDSTFLLHETTALTTALRIARGTAGTGKAAEDGLKPLQLADAPVEAPPPVVEEKDFVLNDAEGGWADDSDSDGDMFAEDDDFLKATKAKFGELSFDTGRRSRSNSNAGAGSGAANDAAAAVASVESRGPPRLLTRASSEVSATGERGRQQDDRDTGRSQEVRGPSSWQDTRDGGRSLGPREPRFRPQDRSQDSRQDRFGDGSRDDRRPHNRDRDRDRDRERDRQDRGQGGYRDRGRGDRSDRRDGGGNAIPVWQRKMERGEADSSKFGGQPSGRSGSEGGGGGGGESNRGGEGRWRSDSRGDRRGSRGGGRDRSLDRNSSQVNMVNTVLRNEDGHGSRSSRRSEIDERGMTVTVSVDTEGAQGNRSRGGRHRRNGSGGSSGGGDFSYSGGGGGGRNRRAKEGFV